jgi:ABC-type branched-subunit amino acid transport system ATPase component
LDVPQGTIVTLLGANGAGKTTLLITIAGVLAPTAGSITYQGRPLPNKTPDRAAKAGVLLVPERRELFLRTSVGDNIKLGGYLRRRQTDLRHASLAVKVPGILTCWELGEMMVQGTPADLQASAAVRAAFL